MFFRIYPLDPGGRYQPPHECECEDDAAALAEAGLLGERIQHGFDLWQLERYLGRYRPDGAGPPILVSRGAMGRDS